MEMEFGKDKKVLFDINGVVGIIICMLLTVFVRLLFPYSDGIDVEFRHQIENMAGHTYLYQADPYFFYNLAVEHYNGTVNSWFMGMYSWLPVILTCICCIYVFYLVYMYTRSKDISFISTFIFCTNYYFLLSSYMGMSDNNMIIHLLSLMIVSNYLLFIYSKSKVLSYLNMINFFICFGLLGFFWRGWFYISIVMFLSWILYFIVNYNNMFKSIFKLYQFIIMLTILSLIVCMVLYFSGAFDIVSSILVTTGNNRYISELSSSFTDIWFLSFGFLVGILLFVVWLGKTDDYKYNLLITWYFSMFVAALFLLRFRSFFIIPLCITLGVILYRLRKQTLPFDYGYFVMLLLVIYTLSTGYTVLKSEFNPMMDDSVYNVSMYVNSMNSTGVILGDWDYGHIYHAYMDNNVRYRGNIPRDLVYYEAMLSTDENRTLALLDNVIRDHIVIVNSDRIYNYPSMMNMPLNNDSFVSKALYEPGRLEYYDQRYCSETQLKRVCVLTKKT